MTMDELDAAREHLAQTTRTLRLLNFKLMQLCHTNDQLLAGLQDLLDRTNSDRDGQAPPPLPTKDSP
jgi:hypothetical protein